MSRSELSHDLWAEDTPASRHRIKQQIAQIRIVLGTLSIEFQQDGYRLLGSFDRLDATLFEWMVANAQGLDVATRAERFTDALSLWRGPVAFHGVDSLLVDDARRRLESGWASTVVALADCEIELRRPGHAVELLRRQFDDDPTAPDVAMRLATLLAIGHRDVEGRRVIGRHRDALIAVGFSLDPGLADLERRILRQEFRSPIVMPAHDPIVMGDSFHDPERLIERPEFERRVNAALAVEPVVVVGEPGVGKTVLALAVARAAEDAGRLVVRVSAHAEPTRPMEVAAAIAEQLRRLRPELLEEQLARPSLAAAVVRLSGDHGASGGPVLSREVLIVELTALARSIVDDADGLLVVEDAHWLDHSSAEIVGRLIEEGRPGLLVTTRRTLSGVFGPMWEGGLSVELPPFTVSEVRAIVELALPGRVTGDLVQRLHRGSGGNGVFLRLELDLLIDGDREERVSPTLLEAVNERTRRFSEATRTVLQTAALLGQSFPLAPLRLLHPHIEDTLREAVDERLVRLDTANGVGEFVHGLVVDALIELLGSATRVARHDRLCRALLSLHESSIAVATQAVGAELLDPIRAVVSCLGAAREQAGVFEWASTIAWAQLGITVCERSGFDDPGTEAELRALIGTGLRRLSLPGSDQELARGSDLAALAGAHDLLVRCVTELCLHGPTTKVGMVDEAGRRHLERALAAPVDAGRRAELLAAAATLMALSDETPVGHALYRQALDAAEGAGDAVVLRTVRMNAHIGLCHPDDLAERRRASAGLLALDDHEARWEGNFLRFGIALIDADRVSLDDSADSLRQLTSVVKQRDQQRAMLQVDAVHAFVRGEFDRAESLANETLKLGLTSYPLSWATGIYAALLLPIREAQGRAGELVPEVLALIEAAPGFVTWHALAAGVAYARNDRAVMKDELAHLAAGDFQFAEDLTWTAVATTVCRPIRGAARHRRGGRSLPAAAAVHRADDVERIEYAWPGRCRAGVPGRRPWRPRRSRPARRRVERAGRTARRAAPPLARARRHPRLVHRARDRLIAARSSLHAAAWARAGSSGSSVILANGAWGEPISGMCAHTSASASSRPSCCPMSSRSLGRSGSSSNSSAQAAIATAMPLFALSGLALTSESECTWLRSSTRRLRSAWRCG